MAQILVIDDQEDIVKLVVKALELQNHKVTGLTSVLDLDKNSLPRFDLILLDIMMPDVDGLQFCHEIREQVDCPILFITARTQEGDIVQGLSYGADDYICKPFGVKELQARVAARRDGNIVNVTISFHLEIFSLICRLRSFMLRISC